MCRGTSASAAAAEQQTLLAAAAELQLLQAAQQLLLQQQLLQTAAAAALQHSCSICSNWRVLLSLTGACSCHFTSTLRGSTSPSPQSDSLRLSCRASTLFQVVFLFRVIISSCHFTLLLYAAAPDNGLLSASIPDVAPRHRLPGVASWHRKGHDGECGTIHILKLRAYNITGKCSVEDSFPKCLFFCLILWIVSGVLWMKHHRRTNAISHVVRRATNCQWVRRV
jgi:hypothetical protein